MKMWHKAGIAVVLGFVMAAPAWAGEGPFGIAMGTKLSKLTLAIEKRIANIGSLESYAIVPPVPNASFEDYLVQLTAKTGVCEISGYGYAQENDPEGTKVSEIYKTLKSALVAKYGAPSEVKEGLHNDASLTGRHQFATSLNTNQRDLQSRWKPTGSTSDIQSIFLFASSSDGRTTRVSINYRLKNYSQCVEEATPKETGAGL